MFFFNETATTEIYTLSLHDALPISVRPNRRPSAALSRAGTRVSNRRFPSSRDRQSTRLNSSHSQISYAVFCLKKNELAIIVGIAVSLAPDIRLCRPFFLDEINKYYV